MKTIRSLLLALLVAATLAACGGPSEEPAPTGTWGESNWNQVRWGE